MPLGICSATGRHAAAAGILQGSMFTIYIGCVTAIDPLVGTKAYAFRRDSSQQMLLCRLNVPTVSRSMTYRWKDKSLTPRRTHPHPTRKSMTSHIPNLHQESQKRRIKTSKRSFTNRMDTRTSCLTCLPIKSLNMDKKQRKSISDPIYRGSEMILNEIRYTSETTVAHICRRQRTFTVTDRAMSNSTYWKRRLFLRVKPGPVRASSP
ncbi:hypothetical protein OG21DRAFT_95082 [Imleria badia]|nr:hypothetical protein OG21DRAFT_95082 [Imleria badia]